MKRPSFFSSSDKITGVSQVGHRPSFALVFFLLTLPEKDSADNFNYYIKNYHGPFKKTGESIHQTAQHGGDIAGRVSDSVT